MLPLNSFSTTTVLLDTPTPAVREKRVCLAGGYSHVRSESSCVVRIGRGYARDRKRPPAEVAAVGRKRAREQVEYLRTKGSACESLEY